MTRQEYIAQCAQNNGMTALQYTKTYVVLPCKCDGDSCPGWRSVWFKPEADNFGSMTDTEILGVIQPTDPT